jgi:hypothetical protein
MVKEVTGAMARSERQYQTIAGASQSAIPIMQFNY